MNINTKTTKSVSLKDYTIATGFTTTTLQNGKPQTFANTYISIHSHEEKKFSNQLSQEDSINITHIFYFSG